MKINGLVVFDLDGTLLRGPTICELLAEPLGRSVEMKRFESMMSQEEIALARLEMAKWYRGTSRETLLKCLDSPCWARGAQAAVSRLKRANLEVAIASITWDFAVNKIATDLGIARFLGTGLQPDGTITHVWPEDKAVWAYQLASSLGLGRERTAAVGDSPNDTPMLRAAGLPFYLGESPPAGLDCVHAPSGDLLPIADEIISRWSA